MDYFIPILFILIIGGAVYYYINKRVKTYRGKLIDSYTFPKRLTDSVKKVYPHLSDHQLKRVIRGLREYFHLIALSKRKMVSMPSQVVDVAWHEFILFTKQYEIFCNRALGHFLHHTPAEAMRSKTVAQEGIRRAWRLSCFRAKIDPKSPTRLPLLFGIDEELKIEDGFKYQLNCMNTNTSKNEGGCSGYCATDIGCSSGCSGSSGAEDTGGDGFWGDGGDSSDGCGGCGGD